MSPMSIPYDPTRESLFHPGRATDFFERAPFDTDHGLCAEMARLAYVKSEADLRGFLGRAGFTLVTPADVKGSQGFLATRGGDAVLAFRGTEPDDPTDLGTDANLRLVPNPSGGQVHHGFLEGLDFIWPVLAPRIPAQGRLLMTGHSLGAALATIAATRRRPDVLVTVGSPQVGDAAFGATLAGVAHTRYVDCADVVTRLPPDFLGSVHTGKRLYIDRKGRVQPGFTEAQIHGDRVRAEIGYLALAFRPGNAPVRSLADHAPINYVSGVTGTRA